jgi:hypothetical protein
MTLLRIAWYSSHAHPTKGRSDSGGWGGGLMIKSCWRQYSEVTPFLQRSSTPTRRAPPPFLSCSQPPTQPLWFSSGIKGEWARRPAQLCPSPQKKLDFCPSHKLGLINSADHQEGRTNLRKEWRSAEGRVLLRMHSTTPLPPKPRHTIRDRSSLFVVAVAPPALQASSYVVVCLWRVEPEEVGEVLNRAPIPCVRVPLVPARIVSHQRQSHTTAHARLHTHATNQTHA